MRPHDMKYIGFKHQRENKQNSDNTFYQLISSTRRPLKKNMFVHKTIGLYIYKLKDEAIHSERLLSI